MSHETQVHKQNVTFNTGTLTKYHMKHTYTGKMSLRLHNAFKDFLIQRFFTSIFFL